MYEPDYEGLKIVERLNQEQLRQAALIKQGEAVGLRFTMQFRRAQSFGVFDLESGKQLLSCLQRINEASERYIAQLETIEQQVISTVDEWPVDE